MDNNLQEALNAVQKLKGMSASQYRYEAHHNYQSYGRFEDILHIIGVKENTKSSVSWRN